MSIKESTLHMTIGFFMAIIVAILIGSCFMYVMWTIINAQNSYYNYSCISFSKITRIVHLSDGVELHLENGLHVSTRMVDRYKENDLYCTKFGDVRNEEQN